MSSTVGQASSSSKIESWGPAWRHFTSQGISIAGGNFHDAPLPGVCDIEFYGPTQILGFLDLGLFVTGYFIIDRSHWNCRLIVIIIDRLIKSVFCTWYGKKYSYTRHRNSALSGRREGVFETAKRPRGQKTKLLSFSYLGMKRNLFVPLWVSVSRWVK
jgi:hypothetical protein